MLIIVAVRLVSKVSAVAVSYWGSLTALWEVWDSVKMQVSHSVSNTFACGMK